MKKLWQTAIKSSHVLERLGIETIEGHVPIMSLHDPSELISTLKDKFAKGNLWYNEDYFDLAHSNVHRNPANYIRSGNLGHDVHIYMKPYSADGLINPDQIKHVKTFSGSEFQSIIEKSFSVDSHGGIASNRPLRDLNFSKFYKQFPIKHEEFRNYPLEVSHTLNVEGFTKMDQGKMGVEDRIKTTIERTKAGQDFGNGTGIELSAAIHRRGEQLGGNSGLVSKDVQMIIDPKRVNAIFKGDIATSVNKGVRVANLDSSRANPFTITNSPFEAAATSHEWNEALVRPRYGDYYLRSTSRDSNVVSLIEQENLKIKDFRASKGHPTELSNGYHPWLSKTDPYWDLSGLEDEDQAVQRNVINRIDAFGKSSRQVKAQNVYERRNFYDRQHHGHSKYVQEISRQEAIEAIKATGKWDSKEVMDLYQHGTRASRMSSVDTAWQEQQHSRAHPEQYAITDELPITTFLRNQPVSTTSVSLPLDVFLPTKSYKGIQAFRDSVATNGKAAAVDKFTSAVKNATKHFPLLEHIEGPITTPTAHSHMQRGIAAWRRRTTDHADFAIIPSTLTHPHAPRFSSAPEIRSQPSLTVDLNYRGQVNTYYNTAEAFEEL